MPVNFFTRRKALLKKNFLELIPVRMRLHEVNADGKVSLIVPKFKNEKFARWFVPRRKSINFKIHLDEVGSSVWMEIDGRKTVGEICDLLDEKYKDRLSAANKNTMKFLSLLYNQRYISFTVVEVYRNS
jgi:hypothetical protein